MSLNSLLASHNVENIAKRLLGAKISTTVEGSYTSGIIVETEAYKAPHDKGSHAYGNRRTQRTETLFSKPGSIYVYLCYGIHHLVNVVTGPEGVAHAVLIRAIEPVDGIDKMLMRRKMKGSDKRLTNGPGKLSQALGITTSYDTYDLLSSDPMISLSLPGRQITSGNIICSPRVGISYAGECAYWPWRYRIKDNIWTSQPKVVVYDH